MTQEEVNKMNEHLRQLCQGQKELQIAVLAITQKLDPEDPRYILRPIETTLRPIAHTYDTANTVGRWASLAVTFLLACFGVVWTYIQIRAAQLNGTFIKP